MGAKYNGTAASTLNGNPATTLNLKVLVNVSNVDV
jgi:hypothetical protein